MQRLRPGHIAHRPGAESPGQSFSPQLFHVHDMSETVVHRRGAVRARRQQIHMQGRLHIWQERAR